MAEGGWGGGWGGGLGRRVGGLMVRGWGTDVRVISVAGGMAFGNAREALEGRRGDIIVVVNIF